MSEYRSTGWAAHRDHYTVPVLFNPYTGDPRDVRDVQSDPQGILIVPPGKVEMLAAKPTHQQGLQVSTPPAQPAVPLTEHWLKKFGFNLYRRNDCVGLYRLEKAGLSFTLWAADDGSHDDASVTKLTVSNTCGDSLPIKDELIEYVHQFQRLFFALTGEELKIEAAHGINAAPEKGQQ